jgi:hypothetical protein
MYEEFLSTYVMGFTTTDSPFTKRRKKLRPVIYCKRVRKIDTGLVIE